jgi:hypothetical protein
MTYTSDTDDDEMPPDPDREHVPPELLAREGQLVSLKHPDGTVDSGVLVLCLASSATSTGRTAASTTTPMGTTSER